MTAEDKTAKKEATATRFRWKALFTGLIPLFVLAHFGHHLLTALPTPLLPMIRADFSLDYTRSGLVVSAFSLAYGISQVPAGWVTDRIGARTMITVGICGVAAAGALVALAPTYGILLAFMALMGVLAGAYHPAAPPIIAASVEPNKVGRALGLHIIGGSSSYFLAPIIAVGLATTFGGWRGAFLGLAILAMAFGIFFYLRLEKVTARKGATPVARVVEEPKVPGRARRLAVFMTMSSFTAAVVAAIITFIPLLMVDRFGFSKEAAAAFIALFYSSGLWAGPLGGSFSDRVGALPLVAGVCFLAVPAIFLVSLANSAAVIGGLLALLGVVAYVRMPVSEVYIVSQTSPRNRSSVLGMYYFSSQEGTGVLTPVLGFLIDRFGFHASFIIGAIAVLAVTSVCALWLRQTRH